MTQLSRFLIVTLFSTISAFVWAAPATQKTQGQFVNGIVAIVNNKVITQRQLDKATKIARAQAQQSHMPLPDSISLQRQVLHQLINQTIAMELAKLNNITVSDQDVNNAVQRVLNHNGITLAQLKGSVAQSGLTMSDYKATLKKQLILNKLEQGAVANNIRVTPSEVASYLKQEQSNDTDEKYDIGHILIALPSNPTPTQVDATKAKAEKVRSAINGGLAFAQAAVKYSDAGDALKGGDLGWKSLGALPTYFVQPASQLQTGGVYGPFKTAGGYHIIKLLGKKAAPQQRHFVTQYQVWQIVIKTTPVKSNLAAKAQAERVRIALQNKAKFAQEAKANSSDTNTLEQGGSLGWVTLSQLPPPVADAVVDLANNAVSSPIKVGSSWYLVKVTGKRQHDDTQNYMKRQAQMAIFQRKAAQAVQTWQAQVRGASYVKILVPALKNQGV